MTTTNKRLGKNARRTRRFTKRQLAIHNAAKRAKVITRQACKAVVEVDIAVLPDLERGLAGNPQSIQQRGRARMGAQANEALIRDGLRQIEWAKAESKIKSHPDKTRRILRDALKNGSGLHSEFVTRLSGVMDKLTGDDQAIMAELEGYVRGHDTAATELPKPKERGAKPGDPYKDFRDIECASRKLAEKCATQGGAFGGFVATLESLAEAAKKARHP